MKTTKLAITDLDFSKYDVSYLYKIFESVVNKNIIKVQLYNSNTSKYAIATFKDVKSSSSAYQFCDGTEIETSGHILNLSYVPNGMEFDTLEDECTDSVNFKYTSFNQPKHQFDENDIDISEEGLPAFDIPEEFRSKVSEVPIQNLASKAKPINDENSMKKVFEKVENQNDCKDFSINLEDERFKDMFENNDFGLDASNKKYKLQGSSKSIVDKKNKSQPFTD